MAAKTIALHGLSGGGTAAAAPPNLTRGALELFEAVPIPAGSEPGAPLGEIPFQFNPKELTIAKAAKWERKPARGSKDAGPPEFIGSEPCKLTMELFFDATATLDASVVASVEQLLTCCVSTGISHGKKKGTPPLVVMHWGQVRSFQGFITSVQAKYTLFTAEGVPIRATCSVSIEEMPGNPKKQNPTSGGLALTSVRTVVVGDSLASIAYAEYGDPTLWRPLAAFNGIDDPLRLRSGATLQLPVVDDLMAAELARV